MSRLLLGMPVTYSYPLDSGSVVHNAGLFPNEQSWIDTIDISIKSWSGFYEVEILKGGGTVLADIMNCSIVSNALHQDVLQIRSVNTFPGTSFLIHWTLYGSKLL